MLSSLLLAAVLAASPAPASLALAPPALAAPAAAPGATPTGLRWDDEDSGDDEEDRGDEPPRRHLLLAGWGGEAIARGGSGRSSGFWGGEAAWIFPSLDLGVAWSEYRSLRDASRLWTPVILTRLTQRFMTRRGFEAAFTIGLGAGRPKGWIGWYQVAIGLRVPLGPVFAGAELAFEQYDIIRLAGGLGVTF